MRKARLPVVFIRPPAPPAGPPDIPMSTVAGTLRAYRDNGDPDLFHDHLDWLLQNFRFNDDGAYLL